MSRKDREEWEAWLAADPALRAAWNGFRGTLDHVAGLMTTEDPAPDLDPLREAMRCVMNEAGEDHSRH